MLNLDGVAHMHTIVLYYAQNKNWSSYNNIHSNDTSIMEACNNNSHYQSLETKLNKLYCAKMNKNINDVYTQ